MYKVTITATHYNAQNKIPLNTSIFEKTTHELYYIFFIFALICKWHFNGKYNLLTMTLLRYEAEITKIEAGYDKTT